MKAKRRLQTRPNIVLVITDQQSGMAMSCAGNEYLKTPAMDSLAETGVLFHASYCAFPLCVPARATMFTGAMPHEIDMMSNELAMPEHVRPRVMGHALTAAGYCCVYGGKWHAHEIEMPEDRGFEKIAGFNDLQLADRCIAFLERKHDRPFMMVASFDNPHNICEWARSQHLPWGDIPDVPTDECPPLPANFGIPPLEPQAIRVEQSRPHNVYPSVAFSDEHWRHYRHAYYRLIEKVDAEIENILDALRRLKLDRATLVIFTSDHGDGHAAHKWNQKTVLYEEVVRVPFIVSFVGVTKGGHTDREHLVSGMDIVPTVFDYAGIEVPKSLSGLSLRPLAEGREPRKWRDELVVQTMFSQPSYAGTAARMLRTRRYKYSTYSWGLNREQLIDLEKDPGEMINLAASKHHRSILEDHRHRLERWCKKSADPFR